MKAIRIILFVASLSALVLPAQARVGTRAEPQEDQLREAPGRLPASAVGVLVADESQVPVEEGAERPDSPTADENEGNADAEFPAVQPSRPDVAPPQAEHPPRVEQPPVQP